jgi:hypothetical protein
MPHVARQTQTVVREETDEEGHTLHHDVETEESSVMAARIVNVIGTVIMVLLLLRFVLMLFGANRGNVVVDLVYNLSYPFALPFFGMFRYQVNYGFSRFEFETLIAIAVYGFITWLIVYLIRGNRTLDA